MRKKIWALIAIVLLAVAAGMLLCRFLSSDEYAWICSEGKLIKHGNPNSEMPAYDCPGARSSVKQTESNQKQVSGQTTRDSRMTTLTKPSAGELAKSPLAVQGTMPGNWYFEATAQVVLMDGNNKVLAVAPVQAAGDWMTASSVAFTATLTFDAPATATGTLVLKNDNPSGLPENDLTETYAINFSRDLKIVKIYFSNSKMNPDMLDCSKVYPVERNIADAANVAELAINELLTGPTDAAKERGYFTSINDGVKLQKISVKDGTAYVDFSSKMEENLGGSCRVSAIRAQIEQTLKQFSTVKNVVISIDGRVDDALQP